MTSAVRRRAGCTRRAALIAGAVPWPRAHAAVATGTRWRLERADFPSHLARLQPHPNAGWLGVDREGRCWALERGDTPRLLGAGLDPEAPLAAGHGRVVGRLVDGRLWVGGDAPDAGTGDAMLAAAAGLLVLAAGVIGVAGSDGAAQVARLEPAGRGRWRVTATGADAVMPDARPLQADIEGGGDAGHVVVLAGPDRHRYPHAVLGDGLEATRLLVLERHTLRVLRSMQVEAPHVLEDIAPRPWFAGGAIGLVTVRSGPLGAQLVVVEADRLRPGALRIAAAGEPLGNRMRWLAPSVNGPDLLAVHTPHLGGALHRYRRANDRLVAEPLASGFSNHAIGTRELDTSAWLSGLFLAPDLGRRRLRLFDPRARRDVAVFELAEPAKALVAHPRRPEAACLLESGAVVSVHGA